MKILFSVCMVHGRLELSIFIFLTQIFKLSSLSLNSLSSLSQLSEHISSDRRSLKYLVLFPTYVVTQSHVAGDIHTGRLLIPVNQAEISSSH